MASTEERLKRQAQILELAVQALQDEVAELKDELLAARMFLMAMTSHYAGGDAVMHVDEVLEIYTLYDIAKDRTVEGDHMFLKLVPRSPEEVERMRAQWEQLPAAPERLVGAEREPAHPDRARWH